MWLLREISIPTGKGRTLRKNRCRRTHAGGTPACTVLVVDDLGNSYEAKLAAQEPQIYTAKN